MAKQKHERVESAPDDSPRQPDRVTEALRDIPRLRHIEEESGGKKRYFGPPPPTVSRIGGLAQGCGGVLLTILAVLMSMVALWFGYYLWGPALLLAGGVLLVAATVGVWRGRRLAAIVSAAVLIVLAVIAYLWYSFIPAAGALAPIGAGFNFFFGPLVLLAIIVLVVALIAHLVGLGFFWRRLVAPLPRAILIWGVAAVFLVLLALGLHFTQQSQRASWFDERLNEWSAPAEAAPPLLLGSNTNVTLGYSFLTTNEGDDDRYDLRLAELNAALDAGAQVVRVSASGDVLFERETPRLFKVDDPADTEAAAEAAARLDRQQAREAEYMQHIADAGVKLYIADSQYTPYLQLWAADDKADDITWETFADLQTQRVRAYAAQHQPYAYELVNEPEAYYQYSGIKLPDGTTDAAKLDQWIAQTESLIQALDEVSPDTLTGVTINLGSTFDKDFYERALAVEGLDFVGFRVFQPAAFDEIENLYAERGHPAAHGKQGWIVETWYGYCLAPQRSMDFDADWLKMAVAFARQERMAGVLESDFGCFLTAGGTLFQQDVALDGRTEVWQRWRDLIAQQAPSGS